MLGYLFFSLFLRKSLGWDNLDNNQNVYTIYEKAFLFLFDLLLLGLPAGLKAETMANDTLAVYLKTAVLMFFRTVC